MGFGYIAYSRVDPPLPKPPLVPVASLGCANTAAFMKNASWVSLRTGPTFEAPQLSLSRKYFPRLGAAGGHSRPSLDRAQGRGKYACNVAMSEIATARFPG